MLQIVINPAGASGRTVQVWKKLEPIFKESGEEYKVYYSTFNHGIRKIVEELTCEPCDLVIIGGDGTMNLVVNGIQDFSHTRVGFISVGSGNDFSRGLGLSKSPEENARIILSRKYSRFVDIGETIYLNRFDELEKENVEKDGFVHRRFLISSGIGFDAAICQGVQTSPAKKKLNKIHLGRLIYLDIAAQIIAKIETSDTILKINGEELHYENLLAMVAMNEPYEGGGFQFCPHAVDHDRKLNVCIGNHLSKFDFFRIFPFALKGKHLRFEGVEEKQCQEIEVKTDRPMWVHTDGEVTCKSTHIAVHLLNQKMQMLQ